MSRRTRFTGLKAWWVQRFGAVYMLAFLLFVLGFFWVQPAPTFSSWRAELARPAVSIGVLVFFAALFSHMWVGLRDVLLDYARPTGLRHALLAVVAFGLLGLAAWVVFVFAGLHG